MPLGSNSTNLSCDSPKSHRESADNYQNEIVRKGPWRVIVCRDGIQWILQRATRAGNPVGPRWVGIGYYNHPKSPNPDVGGQNGARSPRFAMLAACPEAEVRIVGRDKRNEARVEQFTKWVLAHRLLPAWKALSFPARDSYFHLRVKCLAETAAKKGNVRNNNGDIFRSPRDLAGDMGCDVKTAMAALADLQAKGWIVCTKAWERGYDGRGRTALFRLKMLPTAAHAATCEPRTWIEGSDYPGVWRCPTLRLGIEMG